VFEENLHDAFFHLGGIERFGAHEGVGIKGSDDGVIELSAEEGLLFYLNGPAPGTRDRCQGRRVPGIEINGLLTLVLEIVAGQDDLRKIDPLALATELEERHQSLEKDRPLLDLGVSIIKYL
jgi:hypothetical protein